MKIQKNYFLLLGGILASIAFFLVLVITAFEIATYADMNFYKARYEKYEVLTDLQMEMEDVMDVTRHMMAYLRGNKEELQIQTVVDGEIVDFFNTREILHMEDVMHLFIGGLIIRYLSLGVVAVVLLILALQKKEFVYQLLKIFQITLAVIIGILVTLVALFAMNFTKYFTIFHEIFFSNDLWLLNPATDKLINLLPEGFFIDMGARISVIFAVCCIGSFVIVGIARRVIRIRKTNKTN